MGKPEPRIYPLALSTFGVESHVDPLDPSRILGYQVVVDCCPVGPLVTEKGEAHAIAGWLEDAWPELLSV